MSRCGWATTVGLTTGLVGLVVSLLPAAAGLEDSIGLRWLFHVRGSVVPPRDVVIVSIDDMSAARLDVPTVVREWPRATHATLVDRLVEAEASVIAFDVLFRDRDADTHDDTPLLADSVARANRVVMAQHVDRIKVDTYEIWARENPSPALAASAYGLAPVPVPDGLVSWALLFLRTPEFGDLPSLPAVVLQVHAMSVLGRFLDVLRSTGIATPQALPRSRSDVQEPEDLLRLMQTLRREVGARRHDVSQGVVTAVPALNGEMENDDTRILRAIADLYTGSDVRYLNFYGPPGTLCTIPYETVLNDHSEFWPCPVDGAVVFVGLGHARTARAGQADTHSTVYRDRDGVDFSGVELHATAFANLLTGSALRPAGTAGSVAVLIGIGGLLGGGGYLTRTRRRRVRGALVSRIQGAVFVMAAASAYCVVAYTGFTQLRLVLPLIVPIAAQIPAALVLSLLAPAARHEERVRAVCLATDAGGSTALGQRLAHEQYVRLMGAYHQALVEVVGRHGGELVPPEGDGFVALWCRPSGSRADAGADARLCSDACRAALGIVDAAGHFNDQQVEDQRLPVRVGLYAGDVTIHSDADRGVFRVLGDAVNVASRLCDLNVTLGTRVLASANVAEHIQIPHARVAADITLKGVTCAPDVVEIVDDRRHVV